MMGDVSVFSDIVCELGEGPSVHPGLERVFWFDVLGKRLFEKPFKGGGTVIHDLPFHASIAAVVDDGRQLIVSEEGLHLRDVKTGVLKRLLAHEAGDRSRRSNDGRVHPSGALWFSTMRWSVDEGTGAIWWFRGGEIRRILEATPITIPNGIAFAPDGSHAYFSCTMANVVYRVETDPATGLPSGEAKVFARVTDGGPDGAVVDRDGLYWSARWGGGAVDAYDASGARVTSIALPARQTSCPVFVGGDAGRLVVTSAWEGMDAGARKADPLAGQTFQVDRPFNGRFDPAVAIG